MRRLIQMAPLLHASTTEDALSVSPPRIYLAGPDVFLPDAADVGRDKCAICREHGLEGVFPLDNALDLAGLTPPEQARRISLANEGLMRGADAIIVNMTPFRGASMDAGTAFEVGFMRALARPAFGYTNVAADYASRARLYRAHTASAAPLLEFDHTTVDVEDFGLAENLMIAVAVSETGADVVRHGSLPHDVRHDLAGFRRAVTAAARHFGTTGSAR